jgi:hypothetical protein
MKNFIVRLLFLFIVGCASTSNASDEASNKAKQFNKVSDKGVVYIYRPNRLFAAALSTKIKINGLDAGGTGPGTFFRWELKPDRYSFAAFSQESSAVIQLDVKVNHHYFIRQDERLGLNGNRPTLTEINEDSAIKEMQKLKLLISAYKN